MIKSLIDRRFQSTRPRGARHYVVMRGVKHRPPFQSTRPRGARLMLLCLLSGFCNVSFQSTRPRGARRFKVSNFTLMCGRFNPRARAGRDLNGSSTHVLRRAFQSTRPRGARQWFTARERRTGCFNPRARAGRDLLCRTSVAKMLGVSIHAPARGATTLPGDHREYKAFQSTRPRGARRGPFQYLSKSYEFQSTRPHGARPRSI